MMYITLGPRGDGVEVAARDLYEGQELALLLHGQLDLLGHRSHALDPFPERDVHALRAAPGPGLAALYE